MNKFSNNGDFNPSISLTILKCDTDWNQNLNQDSCGVILAGKNCHRKISTFKIQLSI